MRVTGDLVAVLVRADQAGGIARTYRIAYRVRNGVISSATLLASSVTATDGATAANLPDLSPATSSR
jgi:hypothetical protein